VSTFFLFYLLTGYSGRVLNHYCRDGLSNCSFLKTAICKNRMVAGANAGNQTNGNMVISNSPGPAFFKDFIAFIAAITITFTMSSILEAFVHKG